jgi:7,8-dihydroneopterin aldolase/epimerase/oxygenase
MDIICINELRLDILIGIYDWEHKVPQTVQLDLEIGIPEKDGPRSDRIGETIDYSKVVARIEQSLREHHFLLLERLSEHVAQIIAQDFGAPWVKVSATKLAPLRNVRRIGVTIERGKKS